MHDFIDFQSDKFYDIWTQQRLSVRWWKLLKQNFEYFTIRGCFSKKRIKCEQNFKVLQLQAVITPQWLQIARNSRPNWPFTGCLVSIFKVRINAKSLHKKGTYSKFLATSTVLILHIKTNSTLQCWCGLASDILKKSRLNSKLNK